MPSFYLRHPRHGEKVAISHEEMAADLAHGWEEFDPNAPAEPQESVEAPRINGLEAKRRRRTPEV